MIHCRKTTENFCHMIKKSVNLSFYKIQFNNLVYVVSKFTKDNKL
jgi:hypothetical protein